MKLPDAFYRCLLALLLTLAGSRSVTGGEYAADFLYLGVGAPAAGMGGAWGTSAEGAENCYWNAAVDYRSPGGLMAEQALHFGGLSSWQAVFGKFPIGRSTGVSAGLLYNHVADLLRYEALAPYRDLTQPDQRSDFTPLGSFDAASSTILVNVAHASDFALVMKTGLLPTSLPSVIHYGLNLKFISETIDDSRGSALASDLGLRLVVNGPTINRVESKTRVILILNIQNAFGGEQTWDTAANTKEELHRNFRLGLAWETGMQGMLSGLRFALERDTYGDDQFHLGAQTEIYRTLILRLGGSGHSLNHLNPAFGTGFRFRNLQADYAFVLHPELEATHRVSLSLSY